MIAVIFTVPSAMAFTVPSEDTVAIFGLLELQEKDFFKFSGLYTTENLAVFPIPNIVFPFKDKLFTRSSVCEPDAFFFTVTLQ